MKTIPSLRPTLLTPTLSALGLCLLLAGPAAHADTATTAWSGATDSTWSTGTNWASGVPSASNSALFDSTFSNQPQLTSTATTQGIWLATGVGQDVVIGKDGSSRTLTITGNATLGDQANAGILLNDSGNHSLTLGDASLNNYVITTTNSTGFYVNNAGTLTLTGLSNLSIGAGTTLTLGGNNTSGKIVILKGIAGTTGAIVVNTAGGVTLSNQNAYSGGTTLTAGTLNINHAKAIGTADGRTLAINGGTIDNTSAAAITLGQAYAISIGGNFAFTGTKNLSFGTSTVDLTGATRTITANAGLLTLGGVVSNGGLTKAGAGTLALSNSSNSYTGATTVSAGTLLIAAGGSVNTSSGISVASGATIESASAAAVTPSLALTEGAAVLTSAGSSSFAPASLTLSGNLSDGWTAVSLTATAGSGLTKGGALTLSLTGITAGTYNLTSGTGFSGSFASANVNGSALTQSGSDFTGTNIGGFDYFYTNSTNVLQVTAVPEPATWALLALSLTTIVVLRRRRSC